MSLRETYENTKDRLQENRQVASLITAGILVGVLETDAHLHKHYYYVQNPFTGLVYGPVQMHNSYIYDSGNTVPGGSGILIYQDPQTLTYSFSDRSGSYPFQRQNIQVGQGVIIEAADKEHDGGFLSEGSFLTSQQHVVE